MKDTDCVHFLQWALPKFRLRWPGFRRVRGQVCKRLSRRLTALGLKDLSEYRALLEVDIEPYMDMDIAGGYRFRVGGAQLHAQVAGYNIFDSSGFQFYLLKKRNVNASLSVSL